MANRSAPAVAVQQILAADAQPCLETVRWVVDACVDDFGVARGGFFANLSMALDYEHVAALERQRAGDCKAHNACADDYGILHYSPTGSA